MKVIYSTSFEELEKRIVSCRLCPRLVHYRETVPPAPSHEEEIHWRKPIPGFGDPHARVLILGLAPSSRGGNRTGRIFTGDQTGKFLFRQLYLEGFANQPEALSKNDTLKLHDCFLTASVKCTPPKHKPLPVEFCNCSGYFANEFFLLKNVQCVLALGKSAFETYLNFLKVEAGLEKPFPKFAHGAQAVFKGWPTLIASYHPTPQNVNTGKLTEKMFLDLLKKIKKELL